RAGVESGVDHAVERRRGPVAGVVAGRDVRDRVTRDLDGVDAGGVGGDVGEDHRIAARTFGTAVAGPGIRALGGAIALGRARTFSAVLVLAGTEVSGVGAEDEHVGLVRELLGHTAAGAGPQRGRGDV